MTVGQKIFLAVIFIMACAVVLGWLIEKLFEDHVD
jgi:hypothetical protein